MKWQARIPRSSLVIIVGTIAAIGWIAVGGTVALVISIVAGGLVALRGTLPDERAQEDEN